MSTYAKPTTVSRLNDTVLGAFSRFDHSPTLDHLLRYLGTWSGSDKFLMLLQYTAKLVIPFLHLRARLQHRAGLRKVPTSTAATGFNKFAAIIGDARTLGRIWGLLPIVQWLVSLEKRPPPTHELLTIERLQGWAMLAYYPLEHLSYLVSHGVVPSSVPTLRTLLLGTPQKPVRLDAARLGTWSVRAWAAYVLLQFAHLRADAALLGQRERALLKAKSKNVDLARERAEVRKRWGALLNELVVNLAYLPLTVHWSVDGGIFKNDIWVSLLGFAAAAASFRSGWQATALPSALPPAEPTQLEGAVPPPKRGYSIDSPRYEDALALPSLVDGDGVIAVGSAATA